MTIKIKNNLNQIDKNIEFYNKNGYLKIKVFEDKDIRNFQTLIKSKVDKVIKKKKMEFKILS